MTAIPVTTANKVDSPSLAYRAMAQRWELPHDLLGGTLRMRAAGSKWLPKEPKEEQQLYDSRLSKSVLYNAFADTLDKLADKPFSDPVTLKENEAMPEKLGQIEENVDRTGRDLTQFGREGFEALLTYGVTHILVDYPQTPGGLTLADERESGIRPTFVHVKPTQLLSWRTEVDEGGTEHLTRVVIREERSEADGVWGEQLVSYIRVWYTDRWELYRKGKGGTDFSLVSGEAHTFPGIPLVTVYTKRKGTFTADPPLEDLAWVNLLHWQSQSDQRNLLRFARVGTLFISGLSQEEYDNGFTLGPNNVIRSTNEKAQGKILEHTGKAIAAGEEDLKRLEDRMEVLGHQPLLARTGSRTATASAMDQAKADSSIQAWIRGLENALEEAYRLAGMWVGEALPSGFAVEISNDFGLSLRSDLDVKALLEMFKQNALDIETLLTEVRRRNILSETTDIDQVMARLEEANAPPQPPEGGFMDEPNPEDPEGAEKEEEVFEE